MESDRRHRPIRSFVRRAGRTTKAQARALETLWPIYGLRSTGPIDLQDCFGREAPRILEVGFGNGEVIAGLAADHPEIDYLGIEVHEPGIGHLLLLLNDSNTHNVKVLKGDAMELLPRCFHDNSFSVVNVFFPDPWPKKRHHKRRLVQPSFLGEVYRCLESGGVLHFATDWQPYAEKVRETLERDQNFKVLPVEFEKENPLLNRLPTHFERRGRRLGHEVCDLFYQAK